MTISQAMKKILEAHSQYIQSNKKQISLIKNLSPNETILPFFIIQMIATQVGSPADEIIIERVKTEGEEEKVHRYLKGKLIGRGGFANCYQATDLDKNQEVAIKVIEKKNLQRNRSKQKLLSQIKIHKILDHPNVVRFLSVFEDLTRVFIVVELCKNGALSDLVRRRKRLSSIEVKRFMQQLLSAIEYMHSLRVIHRDLKMANIFLDDEMNIKVGDLGLATKVQFQEERKRTMCGTPNYIAPQILTGASGHSYEVDIWSAGVIAYAMMYGRPPFESSQITKTYEKIKYGLFDFPDIQGVSEEFKSFVSGALVVDPKKRKTLSEWRRHQFVDVCLPLITYNKITLTPVYDYQYGIAKSMSHSEDTQDQKMKQKQSTVLTLKDKVRQLLKKDVDRPKWSSATVVCYVDYSTKYGLGYVVSNGDFGVYFNDSSVLGHDASANSYSYLDNTTSGQLSFQYFTQQQLQKLPSMSKKYLLSRKFKIYLDDQLKQLKQEDRDNFQEKNIVIKQWLKTKHAIMFRLNNKVFQVDFFDGSKICMRTDTKMLLIKTKKGERIETSLENAMEGGEGEISRRIKYIKQILARIKHK